MAAKATITDTKSQNTLMQPSQSMYSLASLVNFISNNFVVFFLAALFFIAGFYAGSIWTENKMLKAGGVGAGAGAQAVPQDPTGPTEEQLKQVPKLGKDDYVRGNKNAKVVLIEYSDFECPFCASFHPTMLQVMKEYGDKVAWTYRHFPLAFHPSAQKAAEASECVAKQKGSDGFWSYADAIFGINEKSGGITTASITEAAQAAGVNMVQFQTCLDSGEMAAKVKQQMDGGTTAGVGGTPGTIILAGDKAELIPGALPFEQVKPMIDKYLN